MRLFETQRVKKWKWIHGSQNAVATIWSLQHFSTTTTITAAERIPNSSCISFYLFKVYQSRACFFNMLQKQWHTFRNEALHMAPAQFIFTSWIFLLQIRKTPITNWHKHLMSVFMLARYYCSGSVSSLSCFTSDNSRSCPTMTFCQKTVMIQCNTAEPVHSGPDQAEGSNARKDDLFTAPQWEHVSSSNPLWCWLLLKQTNEFPFSGQLKL